MTREYTVACDRCGSTTTDPDVIEEFHELDTDSRSGAEIHADLCRLCTEKFRVWLRSGKS